MHAIRKLGNNRYIKLPKKKVIPLHEIPLGRMWYDKYTRSKPPEALAYFPGRPSHDDSFKNAVKVVLLKP
jgi:hypothetical protein